MYLYFSVFFYMVFIREIFDEGFRKIGRFVEEFMGVGLKISVIWFIRGNN